MAVPAAGSVRGFLEHLALTGGVAASTQNQALNALVFFFREGLASIPMRCFGPNISPPDPTLYPKIRFSFLLPSQGMAGCFFSNPALRSRGL